MKWPCKRIQAPGDTGSHKQSALTHFHQAQGLIQRPAGILKQVSQTLTPVPSSRPSGDPPQKGIPLGCIRSGKASLLRGGAPSLQVPENPAESTQRGEVCNRQQDPVRSVKALKSTDLGYHPAAHFLGDVNRPSDLSPLICEMGTKVSPISEGVLKIKRSLG